MVVFKSSETKRKKRKETQKSEKRPRVRLPAKSEETGLLGGAWRGWARAKISTLAHVGEAGPDPGATKRVLCFLRRAGVCNIIGYLGVNQKRKRSG